MATMEAALFEVVETLDLYISRTTTLGTKNYPGNAHWHFKRTADEAGCLDATYWPEGHVFWVSMRNYEPAWVHEVEAQMHRALAERFPTSAS
ncbi:MAG: hypothetical protein GY811_03080 [Myxococcales bacterium]|nr:hypothetical protein [Myxococcales bacterium]